MENPQGALKNQDDGNECELSDLDTDVEHQERKRNVALRKAGEERGLARGERSHVLTLPRSQRSGTVVEPIISTQWYVKMKPLAEPAIAAVEQGKTKIIPQHWEKTYFHWMREIQDWCISRQLWWGHTIPAWYCQSCGHTHVAMEAPANSR